MLQENKIICFSCPKNNKPNDQKIDYIIEMTKMNLGGVEIIQTTQNKYLNPDKTISTILKSSTS